MASGGLSLSYGVEKEEATGGMRLETGRQRGDDDEKRVKREGRAEKWRKKKEDTLFASNQGPDEPVYPVRGMRLSFFFSTPFFP